MKVGEVANFICETKHVGCYPLVAKSLREVFGPKDKHHNHEHKDHHCCGMMALAEHGVGHEDLDKLIKNPQPLMFTLELLKVEESGTYEKEAWVMTENEKLTAIPRLREEGNALYSQKKFEEASEKYSSALGMLEQLVLREKPGDEEWEKLEDMKTPLLLNFSQCKLALKDYYPVIEHTSTVLKRDPDNVKALFRRAKAHVGAWNPEEAKQDFERVMELDPSLVNSVTKELKHLEQIKKQKDSEDKQKLKGLFS